MAPKSVKRENIAGKGKADIDGPPLIISRNKHWRYISCYHGPWLQLPLELLQTLADDNFYMSRPRLVDPGVFFDIVKIRRGVDQAAEDATRASIGTTNPGASAQSQYDLLSSSAQPPGQMSKERIFRVRQKAAKLLSASYATDEVACSVVAMQSASAIDFLGEAVLKRNRDDADAKYIHFFHEKVPSRTMEHHTSPEPLSEVLQQSSFDRQAAVLRTRGTVHIFKHDLEAAAVDFTAALQIAQDLETRHRPGPDQQALVREVRSERDEWMRESKHRPSTKEEDQPNSMVAQLLFYRAGVYLELACERIAAAIDDLEFATSKAGGDTQAALTPQQLNQQESGQVARKYVKTYAKRACRDYMAFLTRLDYCPASVDLQAHESKEVAGADRSAREVSDKISDGDQMTDLVVSPRGQQRGMAGNTLHGPAEIYPISALLAEKPIAGLPSAPRPDQRLTGLGTGICETVTYHPLLIDTLHSLLLCHCLLQTSPTELHRHAQSVARISRIADGYPLFQVPRSSARTDWMEVLRHTNNFIKLDTPWTQLSAGPRTELPPAADQRADPPSNAAVPRARGQRAIASAGQGEGQGGATAERIMQQAVYEALGDEHVVDPDSFQRSVAAREKRAWHDEARDEQLFSPLAAAEEDGGETVTAVPATTRNTPDGPRVAQRGVEMEYPVTTSRAQLISRWVMEAPLSAPGGAAGKKKKKKRPPGAARKNGLADLSNGVGGLALDGGP